MSENFRVRRLLAKFDPHLTLDPNDAGVFADSILESAQGVDHWGSLSVTSRRSLNLAMCFLDMKYSFLCCGRPKRTAEDEDGRCRDCPMRGHDIK